MSETVYFDTSALAKWYLNETRSEEVEQFILSRGPVAISSLTIVEMRSLLARRRRDGCFSTETEMRVFAAFSEDVRQGILVNHAMDEDLAAAAVNIISSCPEIPLRTLDALHLATARRIEAREIATADRVMIAAAGAMSLTVLRFD